MKKKQTIILSIAVVICLLLLVLPKKQIYQVSTLEQLPNSVKIDYFLQVSMVRKKCSFLIIQ